MSDRQALAAELEEAEHDYERVSEEVRTAREAWDDAKARQDAAMKRVQQIIRKMSEAAQ